MNNIDESSVWLLCIGAGPEQEGGIIAAKKMGYKVLAIDYNPNAEGFSLADDHRVIDIKDKAEILGLSTAFNIAGVIPVPLGRYLTSVGYINDALNLIGPSEKTCHICTDKTAFYQAVQNSDILTPIQISYNSLEEAKLNVEVEKSIPFVVKPTHGSGSRGVKVIREIKDWVELEDGAYQDGILIEDFIVGTSLGVDGWVENGNVTVLCVREKKLTPLPFRVEYAFGAPLVLPKMSQDSLDRTMNNAVMAIGLENGVFHADLIVDQNNDVWMIEMAPRPSGLMISRNLVKRATGVSILDVGLQIVTNIPVEATIENYGSYVLQYIIPNDSEYIGVKSAIDEVYCPQYVIEYKPGSFANATNVPTNMADIIKNGYFIVNGKNLNDAFINGDDFLNKITHNYEA